MRELDSFPSAQLLRKELKRVKSKSDYIKLLRSTISSLIVVAALAVLLSLLFLPVLRVTGSSMSPTLSNDELIVCHKGGAYQTGDIVAFYYNNKILIKRVIAVAGDIVDIDSNGIVSVNGKILDEPYIQEHALGECDIEMPYQVPDSKIFVMGDNRATSIDSRNETIGCIADEAIVGRVWLVVWPLKNIELL